jgi:DNA invertase Pin-like site-specific DNA recombinase
MLTDVRTGNIQAVVVWALDRLHRSMQGNEGQITGIP